MTQSAVLGTAPETVDGLLREYETMQNVALCAYALGTLASGFHQAAPSQESGLTLWHMFSALPLVLHDISRKMISTKRVGSGLRSILNRDIIVNVGQNEVIMNLPKRMRDMRRRTMRALNCAIAWDLLVITDGVFVTGPRFAWPRQVEGETGEILKAAEKLGKWAAGCSTFEYLTVLGIDPTR